MKLDWREDIAFLGDGDGSLEVVTGEHADFDVAGLELVLARLVGAEAELVDGCLDLDLVNRVLDAERADVLNAELDLGPELARIIHVNALLHLVLDRFDVVEGHVLVCITEQLKAILSHFHKRSAELLDLGRQVFGFSI